MSKSKKTYTKEQEQFARIAKAIGHSARVAILDYLSNLDSCFLGDIHKELPISKATVSQRLKELKNAGLIQGPIGPPKVRYCINRETWTLAKNLSCPFSGKIWGENAENGRV